MSNDALKDETLANVAWTANVAQFVSFDSALRQRFSRVLGHSPDFRFLNLNTAVEVLFRTSPDNSVNVRTFDNKRSKGTGFIYGLKTADEVTSALRRFSEDGLYTIINETVDTDDGGVSGVACGGIVEFSPRDTPRCVEKPGTASLPFETAAKVLRDVYGFEPAIRRSDDLRIEFSIHPLKRGFLHDHSIIWEAEQIEPIQLEADLSWPHNFSRFLGDKVYGLLIANAFGFPVPRCTVFSRGTAPFSFGVPTGSCEPWLRTCPKEQMPGRFPTRRGWCDPFALMASLSEEGSEIASIIVQEGVESVYSGSLITAKDGMPIIEGVRGYAVEFMLGKSGTEDLPPEVLRSIQELYQRVRACLGPIRLEWAYRDGTAWVLQLHMGMAESCGLTIYPGVVSRYRSFPVWRGLEELRALIKDLNRVDEGVILEGNVGVTSHFGDLLRRSRIVSRIVRIKNET